jgi:hypothetical protein
VREGEGQEREGGEVRVGDPADVMTRANLKVAEVHLFLPSGRYIGFPHWFGILNEQIKTL